MSMTSRIGRNQMVGNVLDYQVYGSPIAYISNEESALSEGFFFFFESAFVYRNSYLVQGQDAVPYFRTKIR